TRSARAEPAGTGLEVWKFGGASLAGAVEIQKAIALIAAHRGPLVLAASALAGVTDLLLEGIAHAMAGRGADVGKVSATLLRRHADVVKVLVAKGPSRRSLLSVIDAA